jgi:hypothetical protein
VAEKKYNLLINIGPPRTGTTYLFDLFHNAPPHIRDKIIPIEPFEKLDKHLKRYKAGKLNDNQFLYDKMKIKEGLHVDRLESFSTLLHAKKCCTKPDAECLCIENIADSFFQKFERRNPPEDATFYVTYPEGFGTFFNNYNEGQDNLDLLVDNAIQQIVHVFAVLSNRFKNVTCIYGIRDKIEIAKSILTMMDNAGSHNYPNLDISNKHITSHKEELEVVNTIAWTYRIIEVLMELDITGCCTNIDMFGLDFKKLNNSEYMYSKLQRIFESENQLASNKAFGKKSFSIEEIKKLFHDTQEK